MQKSLVVPILPFFSDSLPCVLSSCASFPWRRIEENRRCIIVIPQALWRGIAWVWHTMSTFYPAYLALALIFSRLQWLSCTLSCTYPALSTDDVFQDLFQALVQCVSSLGTHCTKLWDDFWYNQSIKGAGVQDRVQDAVQDRVQDKMPNQLIFRPSAG